jgi:hypothetical protein
MPNANFQFVTSVTFLGRDIPLLKPIALFNARRLEALLPQIAALNAAGKSQADAAAALETTVCTLRHWLDITGTTWVNLNRRGPYAKRTK